MSPGIRLKPRIHGLDEKDVFRVREQLRKLGIEKKLSYKTNEDTLAGKYRQTTGERIAKYYA
jgi:hypothetical protein